MSAINYSILDISVSHISALAAVFSAIAAYLAVWYSRPKPVILVKNDGKKIIIENVGSKSFKGGKMKILDANLLRDRIQCYIDGTLFNDPEYVRKLILDKKYIYIPFIQIGEKLSLSSSSLRKKGVHVIKSEKEFIVEWNEQQESYNKAMEEMFIAQSEGKLDQNTEEFDIFNPVEEEEWLLLNTFMITVKINNQILQIRPPLY